MRTAAYLPDLRFFTCDVFTEKPFAGNPLAIVRRADGLSTEQMQIVAREFNLSETIFVQTPANPAHSAKVRIFFPDGEIPFAGHPTIGCAIHLALETAPEGDFTQQIVLEEEAGIVPVAVTRTAGAVSATLKAPVVPFAGTGTLPPTGTLASAVGLTEPELGFDTHAAGLWQGGPAFLYIPVRDLAALAKARPIEPHWTDVMEAAGVDSAYLYTPGSDCDFRARMFSPTAGIPEDPATGSATAILAAQLKAAGALAAGKSRFVLHQGVEMGRASQLDLAVTMQGDQITAVHLTGSAVSISQGTVRRPD
ncbi:PhzF family phenazine biosynthesis protein [Pacificoceanicola onchidii]|uniref:PhzF family phenazine biosynthesis protein n=1 Tax=Pacificoceanicola onchidii TaxID=2562685 RepID=UPI0010A5CA52|nr:PhzF family phenazine biosynthesis protein [Pacificoceanicola onchidii]